MKEYLLTFSKEGKEYSIRRYLNPELAAKSLVWADQKMTDRKGIALIKCEEITGITAKDFIPSILTI
jgi:hypothetical protein